MIASAARSHARRVYKAIIGCRCLLNSRYVWDGMLKTQLFAQLILSAKKRSLNHLKILRSYAKCYF